MTTKITVTYGDGIGPEIMESVLLVLQEAGASISIDVVEVGLKVYEKGWKAGIADSAWNTIIRNKVFLKAPITTPRGEGFTSLNVTLRKALGLYANVRPCLDYFNNSIDVVVIRENEEDIYSGIEYRCTQNSSHAIKIVSYDSSFRICKYAFEYARSNGRKKVTCFVKDNIMKITDGTFTKAFNEVAKNYPDLENNISILDIGAAKLSTKPRDFDVIVTTNFYGDIVSDIAAEITGSVGLAGSVNIGPIYSMFEAVHGSAPDIAGKGIANPSGLLNSAINMLSFIGQNEVASNIYNAWFSTINSGIHTADIYNDNISKCKVNTADFTQEIISNLDRKSSYFAPTYPKVDIQVLNAPMSEKKLIGVDLLIELDSRVVDEIVARLLSVKSEDLELKNIMVKGLIIWPRTELIRSLPSDNICCRFLAKKETSSNNNINLLLSELSDLKIIATHMLYSFNGECGFRPY